MMYNLSLAPITLLAAIALTGCATYQEPITPRSVVLTSCDAPSSAKLRDILAHGSVTGSYTYAQTSTLPNGGPLWLKAPDPRFTYIEATINPTVQDMQNGGLLLSMSDGTIPRERRHTLMSGPALKSLRAVAAEVALMCGRQTAGLPMRVIAFTSIRDNDMMNRQMRKNDAYHAAVRARDEAKSAQKAAAAERRRLRNVTVDEVDRALRAAWEQYSGEFYLDGTTFGKVKTLRCRKAKALIACKVGITATSANGPEYEEVELNSTRIEGGTLQYYSDDIVM